MQQLVDTWCTYIHKEFNFPFILHSKKDLIIKWNNELFYTLADLYTLALTYKKDDSIPGNFSYSTADREYNNPSALSYFYWQPHGHLD